MILSHIKELMKKKKLIEVSKNQWIIKNNNSI
jgi:hypothetical protein